MEKFYYDLHVFYSRNNGFSKPLMIESEEELAEDEVIDYALKNNIIDSEDANQVDYVLTIDENEYNQMI
ncbi:MAG: hypothetical protein M0R03_15515 [Novosphingobium sp.]|nr:hypothetical protein [Novosphingobium sp.]